MSQVLRRSLIFALLCFYSVAQSSAPAATSTSVQQPSNSAPSAAPQPSSTANFSSAGSEVVANPIGAARAFYSKGDFEHALAKYQECLKDNPKSPDAYAGLVHVYLKEKRVDEAAQAAEQGLARTNSPRVRVARAEVWFRQGRITDAEKEWVEVVNSGYPEARAYLGLARVRDALALYQGAVKMIVKAHEIDSSDPDIEEAWVGTLSRDERIKYLETSLAGDNTWDTDKRSDIASYLEFLKERARQNIKPCRLVSKFKATETPLVRLLNDPEHLRGYGLSVSLNGHKNSLMLDTGASGILINRGVAQHAGISKISETKVWGVGKKGRRDAFFGVADSIKIGELEFQNCPVEVMESRSVAGEDGLIGTDVFEDFLVDVDFPDEKFKLSELPKRPGETGQNIALKSGNDDDDSSESENTASDSKSAKSDSKTPASSGPRDRYIAPEMQDYTRVFRFGHDLLVPTSIGKVPEKLFLLDTGSLTNLISPAAAREVTKVHGDSDTILEGISGRVDKVYSANKAVLTFGRLRQENQDMTAFDTTPLSDDVGTEVSGFLGFVMLRMLDIKIDYRDALVDFHYDAKRFGR
ncbi:MAG TPA: aspartyl protease family protein [Verrucomicrobiae bacterium]|nr:aspartyl protease family protein [Verrucomicrobiae bacterium]